MASIILSSIGSRVGNALVPGLGGRLLSALARRAGGSIDSAIGWSQRAAVKDGPRLENFKVQDSRYGVAIPVVYGTQRVAGNVIWVSDLIETAHESVVSGGKGGIVGDSLSATRTTYTYSLNVAIAIAAGEIGGFGTVWADSKVIYKDGAWTSGLLASANVHTGAADQAVDPLLEGWIGQGLVPAYRGIAYVVLEGLQLKTFGNRLPNLTFEVLSKDTQPAPRFLGETAPATLHAVEVNRQAGMPPLIIQGGASSARRMLIGGYACDGIQAYMEAIEYDVTGDAPVEIARTQSATFPSEEVAAHAWSLSPDGHTVAIGFQDSAAGAPFRLRLYDGASRTFGPLLTLGMESVEHRQLLWLDPHHLVVMDQRDGRRGVRVLLRSGASLLDLGFFDVWGEGSAATRAPLFYTQFRALGAGAMMMMANAAPHPSAFYGRHLSWSGATLAVGAELTIASGLDVGSGSGLQARVISVGEDEWALLCLTALDMRLMSFVPTPSSVSVTRPWQTLTSAAMGSVSCHAPLFLEGKIFVLHRPSLENAYRLSEIDLDAGAFSLTRDAVLVEDVAVVSSAFCAAPVDAGRFLIAGNAGADGTLGSLALMRRRTMSAALDSVVASLLLRAGYESGAFELSALADETVGGYALSDQASAAEAIAPLQSLTPFDLVERDGRLVAVKRGAGATIEVAASELATPQDTDTHGATDGAVMQERVQELDLPHEVVVDYHDASRDYEVGSQRARRGVRAGACAVARVELPIAVTAAQAKAVAERLLYSAWASRTRYRFFLSRRFLALEPGDIAEMEDGARLRIERIVDRAGVLQVDAVAAVPEDFGRVAVAESGEASGADKVACVPSVLHLMDLPLLRHEDDQPGVYAAVSGQDGWRGASLLRGDDAAAFSRIATFTQAVVSGSAVSVLPEASASVPDRANVLRVQLLRGSLSGCTESQMLAGQNVFLIGEEIAQFQAATLVDEGVYEVSGLLRGRLGTAPAAHQIGERFVMLDSAALRFLPVSLGERGKTVHFRAVSDGGSLALAQDVPFAYGFGTLAPRPPAHVRQARAAGLGSDVTISWTRCARKNAAWVDYIDVPLDEPQERYVVEVMDGATTLRSFAVSDATSVLYTAAMQSADWGAQIPQTYVVRVAQVSATYGQGEWG